MDYKTIFVPVFDENDVTASISSALNIAKSFKAHVVGYHVREPFSMGYNVEYYPLSLEAVEITRKDHMKACSEVAQVLNDTFDEQCAVQKVEVVLLSDASDKDNETASWIDATEPLPWNLGSEARLSDLIIMQVPDEEKQPIKQGLLTTMLFETGRPVLFPAVGHNFETMPQHIAIAWDGTREAASALLASLPFLKQAKKIDVLTVGEIEKPLPEAEQVCDYLARLGVEASAHLLPHNTGSISGKIQDYISTHKIELLVMGAYSHSRLREMIFGGVTRHLLQQNEITVLMKH
jgi:nucleotide-binding universal stress UspA family protein